MDPQTRPASAANALAAATQSAPAVRPRNGDVVVARNLRSSVYTIRQLPDAAQISAVSREEAVQLALRFAQAHGVDLWYGDDPTPHLLNVYRPTHTIRAGDSPMS